MKSQCHSLSTWKFSLAFLAASISANSTVAWAASEIQAQKNKVFRETVIMDGLTMKQAYKKHAGFLDPAGQVALEAWLQTFGNEKYPAPQVQTLSNGQIKLISTFQGKALTITMDEKKPENININGQNFTLAEASNSRLVLDRLGGTDRDIKLLAQQAGEIKSPKPTGYGDLSKEEFIRLPKIKRVEYLMLLRELVEAAGVVHYQAQKTVSARETEATTYAFHPLIAAAWAKSASSLMGKACLVAGNISLYEQSDKAVKCSPNPKTAGEYYDQMRSFNSQCPAGQDTACNPLVYGFNTDGKPFCLQSSNQPDFTLRATQNCNTASRLTEVITDDSAEAQAKQTLERKKDMVRILESYYLNKNPNGQAAIKDCFSEDRSEINSKCKDLFDEQRKAFMDFHRDALELCKNLSLPDQKGACEALRRRALDLALFTENVRPIVFTSVDRKALCNGIGKWDESKKQCFCPDGSLADNAAGTYTCAYPLKECGANKAWDEKTNSCITSLGTITVRPEKDKCKNEDGSDKKTLSCGKGLWVLLGVGALLAWLLSRGGGKKPKTPASEGGTGTNPGNNGGVRTTTTIRGVH